MNKGPFARTQSMDTNAKLSSETVSSAAETAGDCASPDSTAPDVGGSETPVRSVSVAQEYPKAAAASAEGGVVPRSTDLRLELLPFLEPQEDIPSLERAAVRPRHNFVMKGLAAGVALVVLVGAGAIYQRSGQTALLATKVQENEHLVSTVTNLRERLDAIEAERAREETADIRKILGEIKAGAAATHDIGAAIAQLTTRVDHIERDQGAHLDRLGERIDHDSSSRFADIAARMDKLEKKPSPLVAAPVVATSPKQISAPADVTAAIGLLTTRLDQIERDQSARLDKLGERIDHDSSSRLADLAARIDKLEKKATPAVVASLGLIPPKPAQTPAKEEPMVSNETTGSIEKSRLVLRGYAVVDVGNGFAVIEGREGAQSVAPGDSIPGLGRVLRIERRGPAWVVVTNAGVIASESRPY